MAAELVTCEQRLADEGADLPVRRVGDVADNAGGRGTVWNADFATSEPQYLEDVTMAVLGRGRAVALAVVNRYGTLSSYDPAAALPTADAAPRRLARFD